MDSLNSVTGENVTTEQALYDELNTTTVVLAQELVDEAKKIGENITGEKLIEANNLMDDAVKYADEYAKKITELNQEYVLELIFIPIFV